MKNKKSNIGDVCNLSQQNEDEKKSSKFACIPIGLTQGQFNLNSFTVPEKLKSIQMLSGCLFAFCYIYFKDPLQWTSEIINNIIQQGTELVKHNNIDWKDCGIINCILNAQNFKAKIQIQEPSIFDTISSRRSIYTSLEIFFQTNDYGLFRCSNLCYLIWKSNQIYFVFDGQGRSYSCNLEYKTSFASLICTEMLSDVIKLIKKLSGLTSDDFYTISGMKMKYFRVGLNGCATPEIQFTSSECDVYTVVNPLWAILRGKIHIGSSGFKSTRNRQSMTTNLVALVCNKMQSSNSWNSEFVDQIILLGNKLFRECDSKTLGEIKIHQLPCQYSIEDYKFKIDYTPYEYSGKLSHSNVIKNTDLFVKLSQAFERTSKCQYQSSVLVQVNTMVFAIWRNGGLYYLFDAYARNDEGGVSDNKFGKPCVHMHSTLESLCTVMSTNLNTVAANEKFVLHGINVTMECICGEKLNHDDFESLNDLMDELCWAEMKRFQEMSHYHIENVCDLDESGDDGIFNGTVDRTEILTRRLSYTSSVSRNTNSSMAVSVISSVKSVNSFTLYSRESSTRNSAKYLSRESSFAGSSKSNINESVTSKVTIDSANVKKSVESRSGNESVTSMTSKKHHLNESKSLKVEKLERNEKKESDKLRSRNVSITSMASNGNVHQFNQIEVSLEVKQNESAKADTKCDDESKHLRRASVVKQGSREQMMPYPKTTEITHEFDDHSKDIMKLNIDSKGNSVRLKNTSTKVKLENVDETELHGQSKNFMKETQIEHETEDQAEPTELTGFNQSNEIKLDDSLKNRHSIEKLNHHMEESITELNEEMISSSDIAELKCYKQVVMKSDNFQETNQAVVKTTSIETNICALMWELKHEIKRLMKTTEKYDKIGKIGLW